MLKRFSCLILAGTLIALSFSLIFAQIPASFVRSGFLTSPGATGCTAFTTQNTVTGSRSAGVAYQNTTGCYLLVQIAGSASSGGTGRFYSDASNPPTATLVSGATMASSGFVQTIMALVAPNNYYELTVDGGASFSSWIESY